MKTTSDKKENYRGSVPRKIYSQRQSLVVFDTNTIKFQFIL
jgi:hypothetical protein